MVKYTDFVKMKYDSVRHLPAKERIGAIAKLWKGQKGGALDMDIPIGIAKPQPKSGDYRKGDSELTLVARNVPANQYGYMTAPLGDDIPIGIGSRLQVAPGMSMPDKMTTPFGNEGSLPPKHRKAKAKAKGGNMLGLPTPPLNLDLKGGGMLEDLNSIIAQAKGGKLKVKKEKPVHGGGWLSTGLSMIGLGLPVGMKDDNKLGKAKLAKLVAHVKKHKGPAYVKHLKGAGFFSDLADGVSQGFSAVVNPALSIASHFL